MSPVTGISSRYFSRTSSDPHRSRFKLHTAVLLLLLYKRKNFQEYFLGGKGGQCVRKTTLLPTRVDCHEIWEPQAPETLRPCTRIPLPFTKPNTVAVVASGGRKQITQNFSAQATKSFAGTACGQRDTSFHSIPDNIMKGKKKTVSRINFKGGLGAPPPPGDSIFPTLGSPLCQFFTSLTSHSRIYKTQS